MVLRGRIEGGKVVLDDSAVLPEGAKVEVHIHAPPEKKPLGAIPDVMKFAGIATDLPPDASVSIDRVLYGDGPQ